MFCSVYSKLYTVSHLCFTPNPLFAIPLPATRKLKPHQVMGASSWDLFLLRSIQISMQNSTRKKGNTKNNYSQSWIWQAIVWQCCPSSRHRSKFTTSARLAQDTQLMAPQFNGLWHRLQNRGSSNDYMWNIYNILLPPTNTQNKIDLHNLASRS